MSWYEIVLWLAIWSALGGACYYGWTVRQDLARLRGWLDQIPHLPTVDFDATPETLQPAETGTHTTLEGTFTLRHQRDLDDLLFQGGPNFSITGNLIITETPFQNLEPLQGLSSLGGGLLIWRNGGLESLDGLKSLVSVRQRIIIVDNPLLQAESLSRLLTRLRMHGFDREVVVRQGGDPTDSITPELGDTLSIGLKLSADAV